MRGSILAAALRLVTLVSVAAVAVALWIIYDAARERRAADRERGAVSTTGAAPDAIAAFIAFADGTPGRDVPPIGLDHEYTAEGIRRLAWAVDARAGDTSASAREELAGIRRRGNRLACDPASLEHADVVRDVFADVIPLLPGTTDEDRDDLRFTVNAIDPDRPLLTQKPRVREFFRLAAGVMRGARARP